MVWAAFWVLKTLVQPIIHSTNIFKLIAFLIPNRMIAKEVRGLTNMCSAPLDLFSMLELGGQTQVGKCYQLDPCPKINALI